VSTPPRLALPPTLASHQKYRRVVFPKEPLVLTGQWLFLLYRQIASSLARRSFSEGGTGQWLFFM